MPIYSRPEKIYCISKKSSVQTTDFYSLAAQRNKYDNNYTDIRLIKSNSPIYGAGHL